MKRDEFIESNMRLVHSLCHRFKGRGIEYDDLFSSGCVGLIKAVDGFEPSRGFLFSTYAVPVILGEIKRLFREGGTVKVSRSLKERAMKVNRATEELSIAFGREPTISELSSHLSLSPEETTEALTCSLPVLSLTCDSENGISEYELPTDEIETEIVNALSLAEIINTLKEQDKNIIKLRYYASKTQSQTAKELGITQVQVSRRERVILGEMRKMLIS